MTFPGGVSVVLAHLTVEHLAEVTMGTNFWRFIRWRKLLNRNVERLYRIMQPGQQLRVRFCSRDIVDALFLLHPLELRRSSDREVEPGGRGSAPGDT